MERAIGAGLAAIKRDTGPAWSCGISSPWRQGEVEGCSSAPTDFLREVTPLAMNSAALRLTLGAPPPSHPLCVSAALAHHRSPESSGIRSHCAPLWVRGGARWEEGLNRSTLSLFPSSPSQ